MARYDRLRVGAFQIAPGSVMSRNYYRLRFPDAWIEALRALAAAAPRRPTGSGPPRIPIASLNSGLTALVPDLVVVARSVGPGASNGDWLYSYHPVPPRALFTVVAAWIRSQQAPQPVIDRTLTAVSADDLSWDEILIDLADPGARAMAFKLLPMEVAAVLSRPDVGCPFGDTLTANFRRCPVATGAEIMSWPPFGVDLGAPFSVTVKLTAQTRPFNKELNLYLHVGVRRWMPAPGPLSILHAHNVYLAPALPYFPGLINSRHFTKAAIRLARLGTTVDGKSDWGPRWDDRIAKLLAEAGCLERLPTPRELRDEPLSWLQRDGNAAALVYRTGMLGRERVSAGLSLADRGPILDWAEQLLAPHMTLMPALTRVNARVYTTSGTSIPHPEPARLRSATADVTGGMLDIELLTGDQQGQLVLDALAVRLGVAMPSLADLRESAQTVATDELTVHLRLLQLPAVTADLEVSVDLTERTQRRDESVTRRAELIQTLLPPVQHPTIAIIEISGPDAYQGIRRAFDPKFAIRHGLLRAGRLSQFITPITTPSNAARVRADRPTTSDPNRERAAKAADDLFRQLGVRAVPLPEPLPGTLIRQPALLGLWVVRQGKGAVWGKTRQIPVAVLIDPTGHRVAIRTPNIEWTPLHAGLIAVGREHTFGDQRRDAQQISLFASQVITEVVGEYPDTLLLTHAQNLRSGWKFIANNNLVFDALGFGGGEPTPIQRFPGLRHGRIRTSDQNETPEAYAIDDERSGHSQGIWSIDSDRVFGSTGSKPVTASNAISATSKIVPWRDSRGETRPANPRANVWNPQLVEIAAVALQPGDNPQHWATLVHELRWAAPYSKDPTTLPWPLHLAAQVEEYLIPSEPDEGEI